MSTFRHRCPHPGTSYSAVPTPRHIPYPATSTNHPRQQVRTFGHVASHYPDPPERVPPASGGLHPPLHVRLLPADPQCRASAIPWCPSGPASASSRWAYLLLKSGNTTPQRPVSALREARLNKYTAFPCSWPNHLNEAGPCPSSRTVVAPRVSPCASRLPTAKTVRVYTLLEIAGEELRTGSELKAVPPRRTGPP